MISDILPLDRKSYLTHAILPRVVTWGLHTMLILKLTHMVVIVILNWRHCVKLHLSVFRDFWKFFLKLKKSLASKKKNLLFVLGLDRKIRSFGSPFVITQQASGCQMVILGTNFSILPSHSLWILIIPQICITCCPFQGGDSVVCNMTFFSSLSACFYWYTGVNNCAIHRPFALVFQYVFVTDHLMNSLLFFIIWCYSINKLFYWQ